MEFKLNDDVSRCWYKKVCFKSGTDDCDRFCDKFFRLTRLATYSLLTEQQQHPIQLCCYNEDYESYMRLSKIKDDIKNFVSCGKNLFIHSENTGNGKTTWATKLLMQYLQSIMLNVSIEPHALFIDTISFLTQLKYTFNGGKNDKIDYILKWVNKVDLVVWDDIGSSKLSEYEQNLLFTLINERLNSCKSNIYTSNAKDAMMPELLGNRLYSRVVTNSECVVFYGLDLRGVDIDK